MKSTVDGRTPYKIDRHRAEELEVSPWDQVAPQRARELDQNHDPSYKYVIRPTLMKLVGRRFDHLLDVGCGTGRLTGEFTSGSGHVTAIDPSFVSAKLAESHLAHRPRVNVQNMSISQYANLGYGGHDICLTAMVMQDVVDLDHFLANCKSVMSRQGRLISAITHPAFWPTYWNYDKAPWFSYNRELYISSEFRTSTYRSGIRTLHVHRPIELYGDLLTRHGFRIVGMRETMLPPRAQRESGISWKFPHFLFFEAALK
jgi:2-polyprenyl-3-methyl-5-hydroxy-6-metoxy-1,4-benzoquinol methylase